MMGVRPSYSALPSLPDGKRRAAPKKSATKKPADLEPAVADEPALTA